MNIKLPDWLRAFAMLGQFGGDYKVIAVDADGQLYALLAGGTIDSIDGDVNVTQEDSVREIQGADGATLRTVTVDANGQLIMVPRGQGGNYMSVDANGFLTTVMKGLEGANLHTIAVDADGNLVAVMQGQGTAGLQTIKVDDDGRMYAFISDEEDAWGNTLPSGLTELAARLGSPVAFERRGQVIFYEDFDKGVSDWRWTAETADSYIKLASGSKMHGGHSAYMFRTANSGGYNKLGRRLCASPSGSIGVSMWYRMLGSPDKIRLNLTVDDGLETHGGGLMIDTATDMAYYKNSAGADVFIGIYNCYPPTEKQWRFLKFTMDLTADTYGYAILDGAEYDLSAVAIDTGITGVSQILPTVEIYAEVGNDAEVYVDNLVITTAE